MHNNVISGGSSKRHHSIKSVNQLDRQTRLSAFYLNNHKNSNQILFLTHYSVILFLFCASCYGSLLTCCRLKLSNMEFTLVFFLRFFYFDSIKRLNQSKRMLHLETIENQTKTDLVSLACGELSPGILCNNNSRIQRTGKCGNI